MTFKALQGLALPVFTVSLPKHSSLCFILSKNIWPSCCVFRCPKNRSSLRTLCLLIPLPGILFPSEIHGGCSHFSGKTLFTCDCPTRIQVLWGQGCFLSCSVLCPWGLEQHLVPGGHQACTLCNARGSHSWGTLYIRCPSVQHCSSRINQCSTYLQGRCALCQAMP